MVSAIPLPRVGLWQLISSPEVIRMYLQHHRLIALLFGVWLNE